MNKEQFLSLCEFIKEGKQEEMFEMVASIYDELTAVHLTDAIEHVKFQSELETDAIEAIPKQVHFVLTLKEDIDYRIGCTIVDEGGELLQVYYHDVKTGKRHTNLLNCVPWKNITKQECALWSLLISRIERLDYAYYSKQYAEIQAGLLGNEEV